MQLTTLNEYSFWGPSSVHHQLSTRVSFCLSSNQVNKFSLQCCSSLNGIFSLFRSIFSPSLLWKCLSTQLKTYTLAGHVPTASKGKTLSHNSIINQSLDWTNFLFQHPPVIARLQSSSGAPTFSFRHSSKELKLVLTFYFFTKLTARFNLSSQLKI